MMRSNLGCFKEDEKVPMPSETPFSTSVSPLAVFGFLKKTGIYMKTCRPGAFCPSHASILPNVRADSLGSNTSVQTRITLRNSRLGHAGVEEAGTPKLLVHCFAHHPSSMTHVTTNPKSSSTRSSGFPVERLAPARRLSERHLPQVPHQHGHLRSLRRLRDQTKVLF